MNDHAVVSLYIKSNLKITNDGVRLTSASGGGSIANEKWSSEFLLTKVWFIKKKSYTYVQCFLRWHTSRHIWKIMGILADSANMCGECARTQQQFAHSSQPKTIKMRLRQSKKNEGYFYLDLLHRVDNFKEYSNWTVNFDHSIKKPFGNKKPAYYTTVHNY